jgi:tRNA(adenine34) deaminase
MSHTDETWMRECLVQARMAAQRGEVPVGALVVRDGVVLGRGANQTISGTDPSAHAEIVALREACRQVGNHRLVAAELFVTLEPCLMCVGALLQARIGRVVFGCADPKGGALGSVADFSAHPKLNHRFEVKSGVRESEARELLRDFFGQRRQEKRTED